MRIEGTNQEAGATRVSAPAANAQSQVQLKMLRQVLDAQKLQAQVLTNQLQGKGQVIDIEA